MNDAIQSIDGDVLTNNQPFTTVIVNAAWRRLQRALAAQGYVRFEDEIIFTALPGVTTTDPGVQVALNWEAYFDGTTLYPSIGLPQTAISPLDLWERANGTEDNFVDMDQILNGLPAIPKNDWNGMWEWRRDVIFMPGALTTTDLRVRFASYLPDFQNVGVPGGADQVVEIMQCLDPFANLICSEMANSRGDVNAGGFDSDAAQGIAMIVMRDAQGPKSTFKTSEYQKMREKYTPGAGA